MTTLNRAACEILLSFRTHGATDVTGFGLLGHAREMALASKAGLEIDHTRLAFLPGAVEAARAGYQPGGLKNNRDFASCFVSIRGEVAPEIEALLYDPQTSGGLLVSIDADDAEPARGALERASVPAALIGRVLDQEKTPVIVV
jgi:selenide,water dikinase